MFDAKGGTKASLIRTYLNAVGDVDLTTFGVSCIWLH